MLNKYSKGLKSSKSSNLSKFCIIFMYLDNKYLIQRCGKVKEKLKF